MLVDRIVKKIPIPHEPEAWLVIRKLNHRRLREAAEERARRGVESAKQAGAELIKVYQEQKNADRDEAETPAVDTTAVPFEAYDRDVVLKAGIKDWSYTDQVSPATVDDLDEVTAAWAHREIVAFALGRESETDRGNATSPLTAS